MPIRKIMAALMAGAMMLLLSGCYKMEANFEFHEDETVSGVFIVGMSKSAIKQLEALGDDSVDESLFTDADEEDLPEGAKVEEWEDDEYTGQKITFDNVSLKDLEGEDFLSDLDIKIEDGKYILHTESLDSGFMEDGGGDASAEELEQAFSMFGQPKVEFSFTFPGEITKHEGPGTVKDNKLTLDFDDLTEGGALTVEAGATDESSNTVIFIVAGVVLMLVLVGGAIFLVSRKSAQAV